MIDSYKRISRLLNKKKLEQYISLFKDKRIGERIQSEVFQDRK